MASSSSSQARSIVSPKLYDVFISHRGPDVKTTLAKELYDLLEARECKTFHDREELQGGDSIKSAIDNAIRSSRVQIAIFSKGYAESSWCLDELVLMLEQTDAVFIPVFYHVEPKELRSTERGSYAAAFSHHQNEEKYCNKVPAWKEALASAAGMSGFELSYHQDNLCEKIVSRVVQIVEEKKKSIPLHVAKYPVGLVELVQDFERSCPMTAGVVGIFGLGGSGKTTLAKELFNRRRSGYHKSCFLSDVRESFNRGQLHCLQIQLCKDFFPQNKINISNVDQGIGELKDCLRRAKHLHFLIIVDDIDREDQLNALLPEAESVLGSGTLVIITTRNRSVLRGADTSYKMKGMDKDHAKDLFCSHAFRGRDPPAAYEELVESFVRFCGGLPLSLIVLGADVYNRNKDYWKLQLRKVEKTQPNDIMQRLKISFDGLDREEKQIFIDIACLFNKKIQSNLKSKAIKIWKASGWSGEVALQTLQDKCLVEVVEMHEQIFVMHDHLRDLGRQMADELGPPRLWQPELLRSMEQKEFKQILAETEGRCFHSFTEEYGRSPSFADPFSNLQTHITYFIAETGLLWLEFHNGSVQYIIPEWIPLRKLHILSVNNVGELWSSFQQQLQTHTQASFELRMLSIECQPDTVQNLPDLIGMFSHLEELQIWGSLMKTDFASLVQSLKQLSKLRSLDLESIEGNFFSGIWDLNAGRSLETVKLRRLRNISKLVISGELCPRLLSLEVSGMENLKEMDLKQLEELNTLDVGYCDQLETISGLSSLTGLHSLQVYTSRGSKLLPSSKMNAHLHRLEISGCPELKSIEGVEELAGLETLLVQMPDDGYALVRDYIYRLRTLSVKKIILIQKASSKLNANLFSEVIGTQTVSEIETGEYLLKMKSSLSAITIFALLVTSPFLSVITMEFESEIMCWFSDGGDTLITVLLTQHDGEVRLEHATIKKGYKVTVEVGEEGKALTVLQRIVDRFYR